MTKRLYKPQALLVVTSIALILALATTFAWFSSRFVTRDFTFTTARMGSTVHLYEATDFDLDGYPNLDNAGKEIFVAEEQIEDTNSDKDITYLTIYDWLPSQVYTYKIVVTNNGTVKAEVLGEIAGASTNLAFLQTLAVTPILINQDNSITKGTKCYLADTNYMSYNDQGKPEKFNGVTFINNAAYASLVGQNDYADLDYRTSIGNTKEFYFQIEMVSYDELVERYPNLALSRTEYNNLQNTQYTELLFLVALEAEEFQGVTTEAPTSAPDPTT